MRPLQLAALGVAVFWVQVTLAPAVSIFGVRPDLLLLVVILLGMRWVHPALYVFAAAAGLAQDSFSHGMLGVYGISFLITAGLANVTGLLIYEQNALVITAAVFALTLAHGIAALTVLDSIGSEMTWLGGFFATVAPQAVYHALLTPAILWAQRRLQRFSRQLPFSG